MTTPTLAVLWHMHQPYYRNMLTGECIQPWVRLHGIHSYYDMLSLYEKYPDIGVDINFVPSLLRQLREYTEQGLSDKFFELSQVDAKELDQSQKMFILRNFFMANHERMIKPYPRYWKLFQQRGTSLQDVDLEHAIRYFSWKDYLDLQVFYNLVWFGFAAREEHPEIEQMLSNPASGHIFTEEDKKFVLKLQLDVLKKLMEKIHNHPKNIELTTTPYFHPITPLLIDTDIAKRCMPKVELPAKFTSHNFAQFQLQHGANYFEQTVGHKPEGMWPSEGSVCPEMIPLLEKTGIKWVAADEGILFLSGVAGKKADCLYKPYVAEYEGSKVTMVFRDRELSDLIGFSYGRMPTDMAVNDFLDRIKETAKSTTGDAPLITVLLDGENAWETYEESGKHFLTGFLEGIRKTKVKCATISQYLAEHPARHILKTIHSGSWINSNFHIWIGKPQKNQGWNYIKRVYDELAPKLNLILANPNRSDKELFALESFSAACGSDWFWWFDDDFSSEFKSDFDKIFRMHLKNTFSFLERDIPVFLFEPIYKYHETPHHQQGEVKPPGFIYPVLDGVNTSFFEWSNAVRLDIGRARGTMGQTDELIETIFFGFNDEAFFFRIDALKKDVTFSLKDSEEIILYLHDGASKYKVRLYFDGKRYQMKFVESPDEGYVNGTHTVEWSIKSVFEMGFKFSNLGYHPGEKITAILTVVRHGIEARHYSHITFTVPDETYERSMWSV